MLNRKRDGVKGRYFLIHKPDTPKEILDEADVCMQVFGEKSFVHT